MPARLRHAADARDATPPCQPRFDFLLLIMMAAAIDEAMIRDTRCCLLMRAPLTPQRGITLMGHGTASARFSPCRYFATPRRTPCRICRFTPFATRFRRDAFMLIFADAFASLLMPPMLMPLPPAFDDAEMPLRRFTLSMRAYLFSPLIYYDAARHISITPR